MPLNQVEHSLNSLITFWRGEEMDVAIQNICRHLSQLVIEKLPPRVSEELKHNPQLHRLAVLETLHLLAADDPSARELIRALTGDPSAPSSHPGATQTINVNGAQNQIFTVGRDATFSSLSHGSHGLMSSSSVAEDRPPLGIRILLVESSPIDEPSLRLTAEIRLIEECIRSSKQRNHLSVTHLHAARIQDLQRALLEESYQIVHFSGHGMGKMIFENEEGASDPVSQEILAKLFAQFTSIKCVILNACYSTSQGMIIAKEIPFTIAMERSISDDAAREFSRGFYTAIGAGSDYRMAYEMGCQSIAMKGYEEQSIPKLMT